MKIIEYEVTFIERGRFEKSIEKFEASDFKKREGTPLEIIHGWYESWNNSSPERQRKLLKIRKTTTTITSEVLFESIE